MIKRVKIAMNFRKIRNCKRRIKSLLLYTTISFQFSIMIVIFLEHIYKEGNTGISCEFLFFMSKTTAWHGTSLWPANNVQHRFTSLRKTNSGISQ